MLSNAAVGFVELRLNLVDNGDLDATLTAIKSGSERTKVKAAITAIRGQFDALGDAGLAEATHFLAQGNAARAAAVLDAISLGEAPPSELRHALTDVAQGEVVHTICLALPPGDITGGTAFFEGLPAPPRSAEFFHFDADGNSLGETFGLIETDATGPMRDNELLSKTVERRTPARRWGDPSDFEGIAVYLASKASRFHTGDTICVDGGYSIF